MKRDGDASGAMSRIVRRIDRIDPDDVRSYGGKAVGLARMATHGIPIPPAFVISTEGYHLHHRDGKVPAEMVAAVVSAVDGLAAEIGREFASGKRPLLVSVRSGAAISMPGMMDTILNLGLNAESALELANETGKPAFVVDSWTRFWSMYAEIVLGLDGEIIREEIAAARAAAENQPAASTFHALQRAAVAAIQAQGASIPDDPRDQLIETISAVFRSWDGARARAYRKHHRIPDDLGTAVTIQSMVFGNMDANSGTGVAFTRDPNTGEKALYGEYLVGHQGEDLVSGTHTPIKLDDAAMPVAISRALASHGDVLEKIYEDAVDIEFTVQSGSLFFLQVRAAKRTAAAAIRIALDQMAERLITPGTAMTRVTPEQIAKLMRPGFEPDALKKATVLATGLGSSPGQATGAACLDSDVATARAEAGDDVILLRPITSPQDIRGMLAANGIVTARGGALSHAAVVSRSLDKPCIVGCEAVEIDLEARTFRIGDDLYDEGTAISIDGSDGRIFAGAMPVSAAGANDPALAKYLETAREICGARIWWVTRSAAETRQAVERDAEGIGMVSLTDLIIAAGRMDEFTRGVGQLTVGESSGTVLEATAAIVCEACRPLYRACAGHPVHLRLPQLRSERARDLVSNWEDIPPAQFLPLGSLDLSRAMLAGIAAARAEAGVAGVTVFCGWLTDMMEFHAFRDEVVAHEGLDAGLLVQNTVMLFRLARAARVDAAVWIDVNQIIRTFHGYPMHILQMPSVLDDYRAAGRIAANPLRDTDGMLVEPLESIGAVGAASMGIVGAGEVSDEYLGMLFRAGFRRFSAHAAGAEILGVRLARFLED